MQRSSTDRLIIHGIPNRDDRRNVAHLDAVKIAPRFPKPHIFDTKWTADKQVKRGTERFTRIVLDQCPDNPITDVGVRKTLSWALMRTVRIDAFEQRFNRPWFVVPRDRLVVVSQSPIIRKTCTMLQKLAKRIVPFRERIIKRQAFHLDEPQGSSREYGLSEAPPRHCNRTANCPDRNAVLQDAERFHRWNLRVSATVEQSRRLARLERPEAAFFFFNPIGRVCRDRLSRAIELSSSDSSRCFSRAAVKSRCRGVTEMQPSAMA